jgi:hypothetical protein
MKLDDGRAPDGLKHVVKFHWVYFKASVCAKASRSRERR